MNVAVCIVGFRNRTDILTCLRALEGSRHGTFEVVICENGGAEAYAALAASLPVRLPGGQAIRILMDEANGGFAAGVNRCMRATPDADAWWILNPDTAPEPDALALMCERLQAGSCEAVGCTLVGPDGVVDSCGGRWRPWLARAVSLTVADRGEVSYLSGASLLVSRRFVERAGYMREDYFLYGEEIEWCLRARRLGLRLCVAPAAVVVHAQGSSTGSVAEVARRGRMPVYLDERNKLLITRDYSPGLLPVAAPAALLLLALRFGKRRAWAQLGFAIQGWTAGLFNERGKPSWVEAGSPRLEA